MAHTTTMTLSQGREVKLTMPNLYQVLTGKGVPNPALAAVLKLLHGEGLLEQTNELQRLQSARDNLRGLYEIAALCLTEPVLRLEGEAQPGEIGPDDLSFNDVETIYYAFFRRGTTPRSPSPAAGEPGESAEPAPDGDGVPQPALDLIGAE